MTLSLCTKQDCRPCLSDCCEGTKNPTSHRTLARSPPACLLRQRHSIVHLSTIYLSIHNPAMYPSIHSYLCLCSICINPFGHLSIRASAYPFNYSLHTVMFACSSILRMLHCAGSDWAAESRACKGRRKHAERESRVIRPPSDDRSRDSLSCCYNSR